VRRDHARTRRVGVEGHRRLAGARVDIAGAAVTALQLSGGPAARAVAGGGHGREVLGSAEHIGDACVASAVGVAAVSEAIVVVVDAIEAVLAAASARAPRSLSAWALATGARASAAGLQTSDGDSAVVFDGVDALVQGTDVLDFDAATAFSAEAWIRLDAFPPSSDEFGIVEKRTQGSSDNGRALRVADDGSPMFTVWREGVECTAASSLSLSLGVAAHVTGVFDAGTVRIYVGGVQSDIATGCGGPLATTMGFVLGFDVSTGFFDGVLDEVAVYDKALSQTQIQAHIIAAN